MLNLTKLEKFKAVGESGVIAVMRGMSADKVVNVAKALNKGGVKVLEVTLDAPFALDMLKDVVKSLGDDTLVGAGTVLDGETARAAILAGAQFIFSPCMVPDVIKICNRYGKLVIPGVMTPTEILAAYENGADIVKIFPAGVLGAAYIKQVKAPLSHIPVIPTGGIDKFNAADFIKVGALAVGVGGNLVDKKAIDEGDFAKLTQAAAEMVSIVNAAKGR
jgi:2-dehydro-3-deoxyphosphogluconate aldolase/(4S)-4-hydroxy-2-oxoglutarate aldolase